MMWFGYVLLGLYLLSCVILIIAVLLQPGKSDAAALFGGGASQTAFGPRGTQNFLGYVTIVTAVLFLGVGLAFSFPGVLAPRSVVHSAADTSTPIPPAPAAPASPIQPIGITAGTPPAESKPSEPAKTADKESTKKKDQKPKAAVPPAAKTGEAKP